MKINRKERRARQAVARKHKKDLLALTTLAVSTMGKAKASTWMYNPHEMLEGESPLEVVMQGKFEKAKRALSDTLSSMAISNTDMITAQILAQAR